MINIIKSVLFDCGYEDVVQTEIEFEKLEYKIDIFKNTPCRLINRHALVRFNAVCSNCNNFPRLHIPYKSCPNRI